MRYAIENGWFETRTRVCFGSRQHPEEGIMTLQSKDVVCPCGHTTRLTTRKLLCIKCGKYVFYSEDERKAHRRQFLYVTAILVMALGLVAFFFVEIVLGPLLSLQD
jgi:hypothetical protein